MNKDVFVVVAFLVMTFVMSFGGHVLFKKGILTEWAIERQLDKVHGDDIHYDKDDDKSHKDDHH